MTSALALAAVAAALLAAEGDPAAPSTGETTEAGATEGADESAVSTPTEGGISMGVSAAFDGLDGGVQGAKVGYEVTGTVRLLGIYWWASQGWRWRFARGIEGFIFYEAGFWAVVNLGVGVTIGGTATPPVDLHFFVGLPIPAVGMDEPELFPGFFVEPYYRPSIHFGLAGARTTVSHEIGILMKLTTIKFEWPWADGDQGEEKSDDPGRAPK